MNAEAVESLESCRVRSPQSVYSVGEDPDVRFSLANERTALAWVRTALALVAGGITLTTVASISPRTRNLYVLAALSCAGGETVAVVALWRWAATGRALRLQMPLPYPVHLTWLAGGVVAASVGLCVLAAVGLFEA